MRKIELSSEQLSQLSDFIADSVGLHFPEAKWGDLRRAVIAAMRSLGLTSVLDFLRLNSSALLSNEHLEVLVSHLTVGETYFFRDPKMFDLLGKEILTPLIQSRIRANDRSLRIWSAACCTGEEAYSIAIFLSRFIPDYARWNITLQATDINPTFLETAAEAVYGKWSFRDAPPWLLDQYFISVTNGRFAIAPEIKGMVQFAPLNLTADVYPSLSNDIHSMDVIFCRNVLMYFTPGQADKTLEKLYRTQVDGGWLIVSPSDTLQLSSSRYLTVRTGGATCFRKSLDKSLSPSLFVPLVTTRLDPVIEELPFPQFIPDATPIFVKSQIDDEVETASVDEIERFYNEGRYAQVIGALERVAARRQLKSAEFVLIVRSLANLGNLRDALSACNQWIASDRLNPLSHYLRAVVLQESGNVDDAAESLRRSLYLDFSFPMAHFALGNIVRRRGLRAQAEKHFRNALESLHTLKPDDIVSEAEGTTAKGLVEIIESLLSMEPAL